ncbi:putative transcriptional regulator [Saccharomonospora marina XMU15]|uniref:Putative transcriptional regulator n=1 Tax=Saccharomonospora marina XMU15 TaxID=882083 RepID=H5X4N5_9PSEU|nr:WYL domain-containing protein [Saccharomonospora marina]EHR51111.1 putative transcriptional regulator [Saccharomonospora marina XMU15]
MRADRLVAVLLLMQARGRVTAPELAGELEVSVATARRDLEALSTAGVPVYSQQGRGGGWSLVGGARTDLSGLTEREAQELFLLAGPLAGSSPGARSALRKLVRALPDSFRADAQAAADAVVVDSTGWGELGPARPEVLGTIQSAVVRRRKLRLGYEGRTGQATRRMVDPWGLVSKDGVWYLLAGTERGQRTFRLDRVRDVEVSDLAGERPADFELSQAWERVASEVERRRAGVSVTVLVPPRLVSVLRNQFGRHCHVEGEVGDAGDGRVRVRLAGHSALSLAEHLAGFGGAVTVVEPDEVGRELGRIGMELATKYAGLS